MTTNVTESTPQKGHPSGLYLLFTVEMWERFSYYGNRAILTLYMTATAALGGLALSKEAASEIYGWYTGLVYLTPLIGGYLADNYLGRRLAISIGGVLMMLGQFSLALGPQPLYFFGGLGLICLGNGFFKPNISTIVGSMYAEGDSRRDAGFTIFYMGINLGALIAPLICSPLSESFGYSAAYNAAGTGMALGLLTYWLYGPKYLGDLGKVPDAKLHRQANQNQPNTPLTTQEKSRLLVIFIILLFTIFFWAGFEQAGSSLNLYTRDFIDRTVMGWEIPTGVFQALNPLLILALAPIFSIMWVSLAQKGKEPSTPIKMGLGMVLLGVGFLFMVGAALQRGDNQDVTIKASLFWLFMAYLFHTLGELCISPVGLSMVTKLSPARFGSLMMGIWFLSVFIANVMGGYVAGSVEKMGALAIFGTIAGFTIVLGLVLLSISGKLKKMMHGIH